MTSRFGETRMSHTSKHLHCKDPQPAGLTFIGSSLSHVVAVTAQQQRSGARLPFSGC